MRKLKWYNLIFFLFILGIISFIMPISANADKDRYVTHLYTGDYSGPTAGISTPADIGQATYYKYINDQGGVDGVKINHIGVDTRYSVARAVSAYRRYRTEKKFLGTHHGGVNIGKALLPACQKDKVVNFLSGNGFVQAQKPPYAFNPNTSYQGGFAGGIDWIIEDWKKKGKDTPPVIGYMGWDNALGHEPLKGGAEYAEKVGVKLLPPELFPVATLDHSVYLNRLANEGANYIILSPVDPTPTNIIVEAYRMGLTKNILFVGPFYWINIENLGMKDHPTELEGTVVGSDVIRGEDMYNHPLSKVWKKYTGKPLEELVAGHFYWMAAAMSFTEALRISLKEVGYDKLDGDTMYKSYLKLGQPEYRDHRSGVTGPCTYGPNERRGGRQMKFYRARKGKLVPITGWRQIPDVIKLYQWD